MAVWGVPVPQENCLQLAPQAAPPILRHQQRGARRLREVAARPVGGSWSGGDGGDGGRRSESQSPELCSRFPSCPLGALGILTDVGGPFRHHVLIVVDAGIRDSGLALICGDHEEFLRGRAEKEGA